MLNYGVSPTSILALTFTNKAAREMINRLHSFPNGKVFKLVNASTFHSFGHKFLIQNAEILGISPNFQVLDEEDQKRLINEVLSYLHISKDDIPPKVVQRVVDLWKNSGEELEYFLKNAFYYDFLRNKYYDILNKYESLKKERGLVDFGDLLFLMYTLLKKDEALAKAYSDKYKYILVDEYQDTNLIQYKLLKCLTLSHRNLTVVGDDDQSIYSFRGAEIRNILDFQKDFPEAKIVCLGKNYRSTKIIIDAANAVIKANKNRMEKRLIPVKEEGYKIILTCYKDEKLEATGVVDEIKDLIARGYHFKDIAIFYRTNQLSRRFEDVLRRARIPYKLYGGFRFYNRKEIKDMLAFIRFLCNRNDVMSFTRIANYAVEGIGKVTMERIMKHVNEDTDIISAMRAFINEEGEKKKSSLYCITFLSLFEKIEEIFLEGDPSQLIDKIVELTGYKEQLKKDSKDEKELEERMKNIEELKIALTENFKEGKSYTEFINELVLEDIAEDIEGNHVSLMTVHASKGLEFPIVFVTALEDDIFPHMYSKEEKNNEEERRLFYVAITRAKERLFLSYVESRNNRRMEISPFIKDIPEDLLVFRQSGFNDNMFTYIEKQANINSKDNGSLEPERGQRVLHEYFGVGKVLKRLSDGKDPICLVQFENGDLKKIASSFLRFL